MQKWEWSKSKMNLPAGKIKKLGFFTDISFGRETTGTAIQNSIENYFVEMRNLCKFAVSFIENRK